jgi:aspartyl-tRNA(Asn)/glutamyl-tRNA(Gln) amidotransferase subunit B
MQLPALPQALMQQYQSAYKLSAYDAAQLCDEKATADYFESVIAGTEHYKAAANWIIGPIRQQLHETGSSFDSCKLLPQILVELINLVEDGKVNFSQASSKLLPVIMQNNSSPSALAASLNLIQVQNVDELENWVSTVIKQMPEKVAEYQKGKKGLIGLFVGEVKKLSQGKADPKLVTNLLEKKLNQS